MAFDFILKTDHLHEPTGYYDDGSFLLGIICLITTIPFFIILPLSSPIISIVWTMRPLLKCATYVEGEVNNPRVKNYFWSVEIKFPIDDILVNQTYSHPKNKSTSFWRINFSRVQYQVIIKNYVYAKIIAPDVHEDNWVWSPQGVINMHEPEHWGYVFFSDKKPSENIEFKIPEDEHIRWTMYSLYRAQKDYYSKHQKWANTVEKLQDLPVSVLNKELNPKIEVHSSGYNLSVESPFSGKKYLIKEDGSFIQLTK